MSLAGSLEHVRSVDLIQFIYIGKRTGTLHFRTPTHKARIGFRQGYITNASLTGAPKLGELLVLSGQVDPGAIANALIVQEGEPSRRPLGQILMSQGLVAETDLNLLLAEQFGRVVHEIVTWTVGEFEFVLDEVWPVEDLADSPDSPGSKIELDTQGVLLDAISQLEQPNRDQEEGGEGDDALAEFAQPPPKKRDHMRAPKRPGPNEGGPPAGEAKAPGESSGTGNHSLAAFPRIQLVTKDAELAERLGALLQPEKARVTAVPARDAGFSLPGEPSPIVVLDVRGSPTGAESVRTLRRTRGKASVVAYCSPQAFQAPVYDAGAAATVHGDEQALAACVKSVYRSRIEHSSETLIKEGLRDGFGRLRRVVGELRSGVLETTVGLNLLSVLAESIERAVLFVVQEAELIPVGSFGVASSGKHFAALTRNMALSLREPSAFSECAESDRVRFARYDDTTVPPAFRAILTPPRSGVFAVFPVSGSQRVIAMIYADKGDKDQSMADVPLLDIALSQLGLALENEFLRRARDAYRRSLQAPAAKGA